MAFDSLIGTTCSILRVQLLLGLFFGLARSFGLQLGFLLSIIVIKPLVIYIVEPSESMVLLESSDAWQ